MQRFTNILYSPSSWTDDPEALARVARLAEQNDAQLTLLGVVGEPTRIQRLLGHADSLDQAEVANQQALFDKLQHWTAQTVQTEIEIEVAVEVGKPALAIIQRVLSQGHDLVVVNDAGDPMSPLVKRLLRKCPCPVWVIKPTRRQTPSVLAAVNPHPGEAELNRTILELAASLVDRYGGDLHVAHAWSLYSEDLEERGFNFTPAITAEALRDETHAASQQALDELIASGSYADAPWRVHLIEGPAEHVLPELVREHGVDLLVMGTIARSGYKGIVIGNTAERVLDEVRCSVMAVKPAGFVSPIAVSSI